MHDIKWIRENPEAFKKALARRGLDSETIFAQFDKLDSERRANIALTQQWQEDLNRKSKEIGKAKAAKDEALFAKLMDEVSRLKGDIAAASADVSQDKAGKLVEYLAAIPNLPLDEVPQGSDEHGNVEKSQSGARRNYAFTPKQHFELGEALGLMDFEAASKLSGARFVVLKKGLARLERALGQFMLDVHTDEHGYEEVAPPLLVKDDVMFGTAQLPKFKDDQFRAVRFTSRDAGNAALRSVIQEDHSYDAKKDASAYFETVTVEGGLTNQLFTDAGWDRFQELQSSSDLWIIPTAEVPLTNLVRESILDEDALPMRMTACTPCFRAEAGAAGRDTRGMIRQHQFTKVELVSITTPEQSKDEHERMLACAEKILQKLGLHYRVMTLCTGDMGFASQKTYDIEVWLPGQNMYREISSCSVCGDFQARRMGARYRTKEDRVVRHVHTLNGSGVAVGRALIAVMETYQQEDGSIAVPEVLQRYMGGVKVIGKV
jgi:seryl-tRNA synthetase